MRKWLHTYVELLEPPLKRKPFLNITLFAYTQKHKTAKKAPKEKNPVGEKPIEAFFVSGDASVTFLRSEKRDRE